MDSNLSAFIVKMAAPAAPQYHQPLLYGRQPPDSTQTYSVTPDSLLNQQTEALKQQLANQHRQIERHIEDIDRFSVEIHKKFSIPSACLVFVLLGAPLGARVRRGGAAVSVAISLVFFWIYWMFLIGGEQLADRGFLAPAVAMWCPNAVFGLLGGYLVWTTARDRPLLGRWWKGGKRP